MSRWGAGVGERNKESVIALEKKLLKWKYEAVKNTQMKENSFWNRNGAGGVV